MMNRSLLLSLFFSLCCLTALAQESKHSILVTPGSKVYQEVEYKIDSLLASMTLNEKIGQLVQYGGIYSQEKKRSDIKPEHAELVRQGRVGSFLNVHGAEATREIQRIAVEQSRLKIPLLFGLDVIHGLRTTFPIPLATAGTFDPVLVEKAERIAAIEGAAIGVHWTFAPMVDIARDPRWGRIAEGAGEDPYLGSVMAAARVRGFQGSDLKSNDVLLACAKHFAAYGGAEGGRDYNTVDISQRTVREVYLPPFKAAVDAGAGTLMASFNEIAGIPSSANRWLLTNVLRKEWGFDGFVVSDWTSVPELIPHGIAANAEEAAILGLKAGVEMDMEGDFYQDQLAGALEKGKISEAELNEAVRRVLRIKFRLGLFENPYKNCNPDRERELIFHPTHRAFAREVAKKSVVLLKNQGSLLPLKKSLKSVAVIGPLADNNIDPLGPWDQLGRSEDVVTVLRGIKTKLSSVSRVLYAQGCTVNGSSEKGFSEALKVAKQADVIILVVGESRDMSGEGGSRSSLGLPGVQENLVRKLHALGKPVIAVLMNGRPLAIPWIAKQIPAILETWFLGIEAGNAIADVLFGDYNPGGKLPVSFPRVTGQVPIYYNHKNTGRPTDDSTRWTSRYIDLPSTPLYPFGYGLSYTAFQYTDLHLSSKTIGASDSILVSVSVKNTGARGGEEVVQLYLRDVAASVTRPVKELKGFQRVTFAAGESKTIQFTIKPDQLKFYNREMQRVVEPGTFKVYVGTSSAEGLEGTFEYVAQ